MAVSWGVDTVSLKPKTNTAFGQYLFVEMDSDDTVDIPDAITDNVIGITQNSITAAQATAGVPLSVKTNGGSKLAIDATITAGQPISCHASNGKGIVATGTNTTVRAIAITGGAAGDVIDVLLVFSKIL